MSLRFRLNLLISVTFVTILVLGTALVILNSRRAVFEETQSTARLAAQLLEVAYAGAAAAPGGVAALGERLRAAIGNFENTRHLRVTLVESGRELPVAGAPAASIAAPAWFVRFVEPETAELRRPIVGAVGAGAAIVVRADPADEIAESWDDARLLLGLVLGIAILANGLFYIVIGRWLRPVERIVTAMDGIEQGDYRARLPVFELPELATLAGKFNRMAEVLERSREQNRYLAQQTLAIQEDERRALAHELHDELGQSISAIKAVAASIGESPSPATAGAAAATITEISSHMYGVVRGMLRRLRPVLLDEFGLIRALENLVDGWNERHPETFCRFDAQGSFADLDDAANIGLYRIVQECLTNVSQHAAASEVSIALTRGTDDRVRLEVNDNGMGFDPGAAAPGLGLLGMRERVEALRGTFALAAAPERGVRITIELPGGERRG